ncbi:MAG: DUF3795 domain-containing protein [Desulfomonilaceae bacterium]
MKDKKALTAPCGLGCFLRDLYKGNLTDELAERIHVKMDVSKDEIACSGCRQQNGNHFHLPNGCATLDCVKATGVDLCCNSNAFPSAFLAPTADQAARYPHNFKVFNLCRIKKVGLELWIQEGAVQIRKK